MGNYSIELDELSALGAPRYLMFAEGPSEVGLINSYLTTIDAKSNVIRVLCFRGASKMSSFITTFIKTVIPSQTELAAIEGIGLIADSETDPSARIDSVIQCAKLLGFDGEGKELRNNYRCKKHNRRFAFSFSPGQTVRGRIEDLVVKEISSDGLFDCINDFYSCIEFAINSTFNSKALVQMYISAKTNSSVAGVKFACENGLFDVTNDAYQGHRATIDFSFKWIST